MNNQELPLFQPVFQVSEYNEVITNHLSLLGDVTVEGEISRFEVKSHRLIFLTIKDQHSSLEVFSLSHIIRNYSQYQPGMLVQVTGSAGLYKGSGKFRLFANSISPVGTGSLQVAFERLKAKLETEGIFDPHRKRPIPAWPTNIGLLTANNSAAYHDVVKILSTRMGGLNINLIPITVQGNSAPPTILKALNYCNQHAAEFDVLILCRGGGSSEDLQAFNDEEVTRAVFASKVPIISAVGHEIDWSLTDYAADLRASTPTNAAELAVRDKREVQIEIDSQLQLIKHFLFNQINRSINRLEINSTILHNQLVSSVNQIENTIHRFEAQQAKIFLAIKQFQDYITQSTQRLANSTELWIDRQLQALDRQVQLLNAFDINQVLKRGFSITYTSQGKLIKSVKQLNSGDMIQTHLAEGQFTSQIK